MRRGLARCCPKSSSPKTCGLRRPVLSTPAPASSARSAHPPGLRPGPAQIGRQIGPGRTADAVKSCGRPEFGCLFRASFKKIRQHGAHHRLTDVVRGSGRYVPREWPVQQKGKRRRRQSCTLPAWTSSASSATRCSSTPSPSPTPSCGACACAPRAGSAHTHSWARQSLRERGRLCRRRVSASSWRTAWCSRTPAGRRGSSRESR